jgi:hypothetical protein
LTLSLLKYSSHSPINFQKYYSIRWYAICKLVLDQKLRVIFKRKENKIILFCSHSFLNIIKQLESKGSTLNSDSWMNDTVITDSTMGKDTFFQVTWSKQPPKISLWNPNGTAVTNSIVDTASKMAYLTIPGTAQVSNQLFECL